MSFKNWSSQQYILLLLVLSLVSIGIGYLAYSSYQTGICFADYSTNAFDVRCHEFFDKFGLSLLYGSSALALVFLALSFVPQSISTWKRFAIWYIPIATILFIVWQEPRGFDPLTPYPEQVYKFLSIVYVVVSLFIIGRTLVENSKG